MGLIVLLHHHGRNELTLYQKVIGEISAEENIVEGTCSIPFFQAASGLA
jgi:hypothetical protein